MDQWVLELIKPETSKLKLSDFGHIVRRPGSLEKTTMHVDIEGSREGGRPNGDGSTK